MDKLAKPVKVIVEYNNGEKTILDEHDINAGSFLNNMRDMCWNGGYVCPSGRQMEDCLECGLVAGGGREIWSMK